MLKSKDWRPSASLKNLQVRARLLADIRDFFAQRAVLEVETPLLCSTAATDPYLQPIQVLYPSRSTGDQAPFYLQTSPEFAMKRLLAAGSGSIYQICKAFREDERGRLHNPEFTMLEWYRLGFDHHRLMDEVDDFLAMALNTPKAERFTYGELFFKHLKLNPYQVSREELKQCAHSASITLNADTAENLSVDEWLDILMTHCVEPSLGFEAPVMIYDFPASKAALARVRAGEPNVAERFEVYVQGIELANGYHELLDPRVQELRFKQDCELRKALGYPEIPMDDQLVAALEFGMPASAGVALGIDRLMMLKLNSSHIEDVIAFTIDRV